MTVDRRDPASVPRWRAVLYGLATVALVAAAAWLAWNTRQTDDGARVEVAAKLQLLGELAARWDLAVARAKTEPAQARQADANIVPSIQRALSDLEADHAHRGEGQHGDRGGTRRKAVEAIGKVDGVGRANQDEDHKEVEGCDGDGEGPGVVCEGINDKVRFECALSGLFLLSLLFFLSLFKS